ncbi:MAG: ATP-dependent sacrificial sulfur transferase LarE [Candidatus Thorarchaeota archaeon]
MYTSAESKFDRVREMFRNKRVLVAFSGGVDSTVLAVLAKQSAIETRLLTVDSITFPRRELVAAQEVAKELGIPLEIIQVDELANEDLVSNPVNRCYHCKKELASVWLAHSNKISYEIVADGTSATDIEGHRPGAKALEEAGVLSPLRMAGITKDEIREFARSMDLSVAERPSMACLSSRFPYGTEITEKRIRMVDEVEQTVRDLFGIDCVRARYHDDIVRIEVASNERSKMFDLALLDLLNEKAKEVGFIYVTLDIQGYRTGSMNDVIDSSTDN